MSTDYTRLQSQAINLLRFPLALGVVFIHMTPDTVAPIDASFPIASPQGISNLILIITSHVIPVVAVPGFFFISGLLFFLNFDGASFDGYSKKLKSRFSSMLVPYLLWNLLAFLPIMCVNIASAILHGQPAAYLTDFFYKYSWHTFYDVYSLGDKTTFFGHTFRDGAPIIIPLWFLRDLIIVSICTPLIFRAIKLGGIILPALLFVCTSFKIWFPIPGPAVSSFFWFSAGAYFSIKGLNVIAFADKYKRAIIPVAIVSAIILTAVDTWYSRPGLYLTPVCTAPLVLSCFNLCSYLIEKHSVTPPPLSHACRKLFLHIRIPSYGFPIHRDSSRIYQAYPLRFYADYILRDKNHYPYNHAATDCRLMHRSVLHIPPPVAENHKNIIRKPLICQKSKYPL